MMEGEEKAFYNIEDYEQEATKILPPEFTMYYNFARERGWCYQDSMKAFSRYRIRARNLEDVSQRSLSTTILGEPIPYPIGVAPTAWHAAAHPQAETETAKGVAKARALFILSMNSTSSIAEVAEATSNSLKWMQIYLCTDRLLTQHLVREAERAGFKAIVITVDSPRSGRDKKCYDILGRSTKANSSSFCMKNFDADIPFSREAKESGDINFNNYSSRVQFNNKATWDDVRWMKSITSLPIVCKGILSAESAQEAANAGADGILVSAHGGRQMDGAPAPIDALPEVVEAVRGRGVEVYMDGGVRTGTDVFKALGRGARAVFVGRPILWGLACKGATGVTHVLEILRTELESVFDNSGCTRPDMIPPGMVVHKSYYHHPIQSKI
ncbi:uncharacterized protein LOC129274274 [Lytechinus pictus]|uniref:uncharacterized protein LOC129274274 n=1 Tax=Lytechinus pictus TaxID=7653 RepID=UPI0030B9D4AE